MADQLSIYPYIRVSTADQSIKRQRGDLADDVITHSLTVVREFTDEGISASYLSGKIREDYENLVALIRSGSVDGAVVWVSEASRMSRNVEQFGELRKLCREHRVRWFVSSKRRVFDLNDPMDMSEITEAIRVAEHEVIVLASRVKSGIREQVRDQRPAGITPYGYVRTYDQRTGKFKAQDVDPVTGPVVTELAKRYAAGESPADIARDLAARGLPGPSDREWYPQSIVRLATNATYVGKRQYKGSQAALAGTHDGCWPALIDEATYVDCIARAQANRNGAARKSESIGVGVAHCYRCPRGQKAPVGYIASVERKGVRSYRCLKGCVCLPQADVDKLIMFTLEELFLRDEFAAVFAPGETDEMVAAKAKLAAAQAAWEELADSNLSPAMVARREPALLADIARAKAEVASLTEPSVAAVLADAPAPWRMTMFLDFEVTVQRRIVAELMDITLHSITSIGRGCPVADYVTIKARKH